MHAMKFSLLYVIVLLFGIVNCGLIYPAIRNNFQPYQFYSPSAYAIQYSYLHQPSFVIPYTSYPVGNAGSIVDAVAQDTAGIHQLKHHHPDHKGTGDEDEKPQQSADLPAQPSSAQASLPTLPSPQTKISSQELVLTATKISELQKPSPLITGTNQPSILALSSPIIYANPVPLSWPTAAQFHQQDGIGQYYYGYANPHSAKQEIQTIDGVTRGSYTYFDANGILQTVSYISDDINGFRVAATNLPTAPEPIAIPDSPDIVLAKQEHFLAQKEALERLNAANLIDNNGSSDGDSSSAGDSSSDGDSSGSGDVDEIDNSSGTLNNTGMTE